MRHLLGAKADPTSNPSDSALIVATVQDSQACCKLLLEAGADADHINEDQECDGEEWYTGAGYNALMTAISWKAQTCFDLLLENTSERGVNQASCGGWTPMLLACRQCYNASWVQSLIETGANVHIRSLKDVDALTLCIRALTKAEECNVKKLNALGSKVRQHIPQEFADAFDAPDHEFTSSMLDSNDKLAEVLRRACLKAHGQEVNRCIDYLLKVDTLKVNRMPLDVRVTPLDTAFRGALGAPHDALPFFKSIISKLCMRGARMHRPLNGIRTEFPANFAKLRDMAPFLASVSNTSLEAGYYTLDFLVGDEVACEWKHATDAFLRQQGLDGPPSPDHPAFDQYALFGKKPAGSLLISTVQESNGFMGDPVAIAYNDLLIPAQHLQIHM